MTSMRDFQNVIASIVSSSLSRASVCSIKAVVAAWDSAKLHNVRRSNSLLVVRMGILAVSSGNGCVHSESAQLRYEHLFLTGEISPLWPAAPEFPAWIAIEAIHWMVRLH